MRIMIVSQSYAPQPEGGAEIVARRAAELLGQNHDVRVLSLALPGHGGEMTPDDGGPTVERLAFRGAYLPEVGKRVGTAPLSRLVWHARNAVGGVRARDLAESLARFHPNVIYAHNTTAFQPQLGRLAGKLGIPLVQHLHDYAFLCPRTSMYHHERNCERQCTSCRVLTSRWRAAMQDTVSDAIAVSGFVQDRFRTAGVMARARWHVLLNVDSPERLAAFARSPRPPGTPFTFGYLGALSPEKGIAALIEAFLALPPGTARLLIAGRGDEAFAAPLRAATRGAAVEWLGHVAPNILLAQTDALVVPSLWHEPQGLVVAEGVSRGLTIIGSDRGGITEVLRPYPGGILFDPDRPGSLAAALQDAMAARGEAGTPQLSAAAASFTAYFKRLERILETAGSKR